MGFLDGKKILVTGLLSNRSIAHGIARAAKREGAELAFSYAGGDKIKARVTQLASEFGSELILPCDVGSDDEIGNLFSTLAQDWDKLDGLVHSIAFAPREALAGDYLDSLSREASRIAHDISSYSLAALAKGALPMMEGTQGSIVSLTYLGAQRAFPSYNIMGPAKASLEANVRYLSQSLGPRGIRVNAISAGPIKTLAAAGIGNFGKLLAFSEKLSPLRRNVSTEEVGNVAAFLLSELSSGVTGEVTYVDAGFNIAGAAPFD